MKSYDNFTELAKILKLNKRTIYSLKLSKKWITLLISAVLDSEEYKWGQDGSVSIGNRLMGWMTKE
jgi:hypothetical protein